MVSIQPTIAVCGTQKMGSVDLSTTSEPDVSDLKKDYVPEPKLGLKNRYNFFKKHSITYNSNLGMIQSPCPFCLRSNLRKSGKQKGYKKKLTGSRVVSYTCGFCKRSHSVTRYKCNRVPEEIIDFAIELFKNNKYMTTKWIREQIQIKFHRDIKRQSVTAWIKRYNRGTLFPYYIKDSKFNKKARQEEGLTYYPHIRKYKVHGKEILVHYDNNRLPKTLIKLKQHDNKILTGDFLVESQNYHSNFVHPNNTLLYSKGHLKSIKIIKGYYLFLLNPKSFKGFSLEHYQQVLNLLKEKRDNSESIESKKRLHRQIRRFLKKLRNANERIWNNLIKDNKKIIRCSFNKTKQLEREFIMSLYNNKIKISKIVKIFEEKFDRRISEGTIIYQLKKQGVYNQVVYHRLNVPKIKNKVIELNKIVLQKDIPIILNKEFGFRIHRSSISKFLKKYKQTTPDYSSDLESSSSLYLESLIKADT